MGEDLSTGAKIGIVLIILVALIGIVFALLTMMKNITNSGSNQLQNSLDQMSSSVFADYDQKVVTGTNLITAAKMFENQDVAIVVKNVNDDFKKDSGNDKISHAMGGWCYNALLKGYEKITIDNYGDAYVNQKNNVNTVANQYYEAISDEALYTASSNFDNGIYLDKSKSYYVGEFNKTGTMVTFNLNKRPLEASGVQTYVRGSSSYRAMLIKDPSGTNIGVCFVEMEKN